MKHLVWVSVLFAALLLIVSTASAQMSSSKSSAAISGATLLEATTETHSWDPVLSTFIKIPQDKELVFDVALECGLYTDTLVRSKGGTKDTSTATADVKVHVALQPIIGVDDTGGFIYGEKFYAHPGSKDSGVTFCRREQQLMAKFQGIFQTCEETVMVEDPYSDPPGEMREECAAYGENTCLNVDAVDEDDDGLIDDYVTTLDLECLDYEEVQLIQDTVSANAFNFVSPNLDQGEYKVTVEAEIKTSADFANGGAAAKGMIGLGSMVVDEVRYINGDTGQSK